MDIGPGRARHNVGLHEIRFVESIARGACEMQSRMRLVALLISVGVFAVSGCDSGNATQNDADDKSGDHISITSVTPSSGIRADVEASFVVDVEYELTSVDLGELSIGFNSVEVGRYQMLTAATTSVEKGSGVHTFNVNVVPQDWGSEGDFSVYVNLSEQAHGAVWTPLDTDIEVLTLQ